jgi:hypothetical protein
LCSRCAPTRPRRGALHALSGGIQGSSGSKRAAPAIVDEARRLEVAALHKLGLAIAEARAAGAIVAKGGDRRSKFRSGTLKSPTLATLQIDRKDAALAREAGACPRGGWPGR